MAKAELGTKRTCPDTGKKFYDLNKDPVVSPYSGNSWPLTYFEDTASIAVVESEEEEEVAEVDAENNEGAMGTIEASDDDSPSDNIPNVDGDDDDDVDVDDDDNTFLETDDDDDDDVSDIIGVSDDDEDN
ncbi:TIGR02300 family protein [Martelella mangrovi]|uniref:Uncharacterized protein (TIGR02300 family) n=1 Tax=Martelella mangrovi TaxID=1397477 RepID=A0ABV2IFF8_9HYPH|nr:TIGR02300 family protein [uncultured Martelella sp.]